MEFRLSCTNSSIYVLHGGIDNQSECETSICLTASNKQKQRYDQLGAHSNTVLCHYNTVNCLQNFPNRYPIGCPWASCQIRKIAGAHAPGMPGTFSPSPQVSDPDMHHGTCVTHVPWCMPGSLNSSFLRNRRRGKTFPAFPAHAQPAILRIW